MYVTSMLIIVSMIKRKKALRIFPKTIPKDQTSLYMIGNWPSIIIKITMVQAMTFGLKSHATVM